MAAGLKLKIGPDPPQEVAEDLLDSLRSIEATHANRAPWGFQLVFGAGRYDPGDPSSSDEWPLLKEAKLSPFNRVQATFQLEGSEPKVLIDGYITRQEINYDAEDGSTIVVTGEDVSLKMDLFEISAEYQDLAASAIVKQILGKYSSLGITPDVKTPAGESAPSDYVPQQNCSDRFYVQMLAAQNGFEFYLKPGQEAGSNTAYWGPPAPNQSPAPTKQPKLVSNKGNASNVTSLGLSCDALAPTLAYGQVLDLSKNPADSFVVAIGSATQTPNLSSGGAIPSSPSGSSLAQTPTSFSSDLKKLAVRGSLANHAGYPPSEARQIAQSKTNLSVTDYVVVEGEVDTATYGALLSAPGLIDLDGIGDSYAGTYVVKEVTHSLSFTDDDWKYRQRFVLTRGGLGIKS